MRNNDNSYSRCVAKGYAKGLGLGADPGFEEGVVTFQFHAIWIRSRGGAGARARANARARARVRTRGRAGLCGPPSGFKVPNSW